MADQAPGWKKPSDTMKKRIIRKKSSVGDCVIGNQVSNSQSAAATSPRHGRAGKKRQNPFASGNDRVKRLHMDGSNTIDSSSAPGASSLFNVLDKANQGLIAQSSEEKQKAEAMKEMLARLSKPLQSVENTSQIGQNNSTAKLDSKDRPTETQHKYYPIDWSLKSKLRFISPKPFSWCHPLKSGEESAGLTSFVQQQEEALDPGLSGNCLEAKVGFQQGSMVWMHPSIPWLRLFPRIVSDAKIGKPSQAFHSEDIQKALLTDWTDSFTSLFGLLRSQKCEYFYLCTHHFTVLFKSKGIPGLCEELHAILTPSSRGVREALKNEGIDFFMPLNTIEKAVDNEQIECDPKKKPINTAETSEEGLPGNIDPGCAEQEIEETDEGASSWLETMGIDRNKYRSLDPNKVKLQRDIFKIIDNRPESTLLVEGGETMALFNYLLNCRSCVDNTGELAGIPPTLLAPVAFKGATLRSMQVKQGSVRQQQKMGIQEGYILEVIGPVLPCHVGRLNQLFNVTQGEYNLSCRVQETSAPFNLFSKTVEEKDGRRNREGSSETEDTEEKDDRSISKSEEFKQGAVHCRISEKNNGRQAIRELNYKDGGYTWS